MNGKSKEDGEIEMGPMTRTSYRKITGGTWVTAKRDTPFGGGAFGMILALPLLLASVSCNRGSAKAASPATLPPPLVTVATATAQDVPRYLDEIGRNAAFESVRGRPPVA